MYDAAALYADLLENGANLQGEPVSQPWGLREFRVIDPEGNPSMLRLLSKIAAYLIIAIGVIHLSFTPFAYRRFSDNTIWFMGAGLASIFAGFLNIVWVRNIGKDHAIYVLCLIANIILLSFFALAAFVIPSPPPFIGVTLSLFQSIAVIVSGKDKSG